MTHVLIYNEVGLISSANNIQVNDAHRMLSLALKHNVPKSLYFQHYSVSDCGTFSMVKNLGLSKAVKRCSEEIRNQNIILDDIYEQSSKNF